VMENRLHPIIQFFWDGARLGEVESASASTLCGGQGWGRLSTPVVVEIEMRGKYGIESGGYNCF